MDEKSKDSYKNDIVEEVGYSDILLITDFGRSGQGWLSYMLCQMCGARYIEPYDFQNARNFTDSKQLKHLLKKINPKTDSPISLIVKSHSKKPPIEHKRLTNKIIRLTRDPRDVAVSARYLYRTLVSKGSFNPIAISKSLPFIGPLLTAIGWKKHSKNWSKEKNIYTVRYEDLNLDTYVTLSKILNFFSIGHTKEELNDCIKMYSFNSLFKRLQGKEDKSFPEARKGIVGDSKKKLNFIEKCLVWLVVHKEAKKLGYEWDYSHLNSYS